jgi:hypothetical protein
MLDESCGHSIGSHRVPNDLLTADDKQRHILIRDRSASLKHNARQVIEGTSFVRFAIGFPFPEKVVGYERRLRKKTGPRKNLENVCPPSFLGAWCC